MHAIIIICINDIITEYYIAYRYAKSMRLYYEILTTSVYEHTIAYLYYTSMCYKHWPEPSHITNKKKKRYVVIV